MVIMMRMKVHELGCLGDIDLLFGLGRYMLMVRRRYHPMKGRPALENSTVYTYTLFCC